MKRQGLLSASGILLLGLVVLMTLHEWDDTLPGQDARVETAPAIIATQVTARAYAENDGQLQYHLTADDLVQYDHDPLTQMHSPVLEMSNDKGSWTISSQDGTVQDNGDLIIFAGEVKVRNPQQQVDLDTHELRFNSESNTASAPGPVELRFDSGQTRAGAMEADLEKGVLSLQQGVESEFNAPSS